MAKTASPAPGRKASPNPGGPPSAFPNGGGRPVTGAITGAGVSVMPATPRTLAVDIGGTGLKAAILDLNGDIAVGPERTPTPKPSDPAAVLGAIAGLVSRLGAFDRVSVGFPGVVRQGHILTAPNLGTEVWHGFPLADEMSLRFGRPARVLNDASVQGLGVISDEGLECVITLGTGFGFALFQDGLLGLHLEMGQHPVTKDKTYDLYLGNAALRKVGRAKWNKRLRKSIGFIDTLVTYDSLLIGGGNARLIDFELPYNVRVVPNTAGITGGVKLWAPKMAAAFPEGRPLLRPPPPGVIVVPEVV